MANFSDTDKRLASGEIAKRPARPPKSAAIARKGRITQFVELNKVGGGVWMIGVRGDNRR